MNLTIKSILLDAGISTIVTLAGGGSFYSFLFLFVILFLPAILVFVTIDTVMNPVPINSTKETKKDKDGQSTQ